MSFSYSIVKRLTWDYESRLALDIQHHSTPIRRTPFKNIERSFEKDGKNQQNHKIIWNTVDQYFFPASRTFFAWNRFARVSCKIGPPRDQLPRFRGAAIKRIVDCTVSSRRRPIWFSCDSLVMPREFIAKLKPVKNTVLFCLKGILLEAVQCLSISPF